MDTRIKLGYALVMALLAVGLTGCLRVSSDAEALRNSLTKSAEWERQIEIGAGRIAFFVARAGLSWANLPAEARTALTAVRSAEVGIYKRQARPARLDHAAMLSAADDAMAARGWDRLVAVGNARELMAVYVPGGIRSTRDVKVCLAVVNERELILASARSNLEPLLALASQHIPQARF